MNTSIVSMTSVLLLEHQPNLLRETDGGGLKHLFWGWEDQNSR